MTWIFQETSRNKNHNDVVNVTDVLEFVDQTYLINETIQEEGMPQSDVSKRS